MGTLTSAVDADKLSALHAARGNSLNGWLKYRSITYAGSGSPVLLSVCQSLHSAELPGPGTKQNAVDPVYNVMKGTEYSILCRYKRVAL